MKARLIDTGLAHHIKVTSIQNGVVNVPRLGLSGTVEGDVIVTERAEVTERVARPSRATPEVLPGHPLVPAVIGVQLSIRQPVASRDDSRPLVEEAHVGLVEGVHPDQRRAGALDEEGDADPDGEDGESSVHLQDFPKTPNAWRDDALAAKWSRIRAARRVVNGALEIARRDKVIGASLEAAPVLYLADPDTAAAVKSVDMADLCITSGLVVAGHEPPAEAFRLDDPAIGVVFERANGQKCQRCWKVLEDVGHHGHEGVCGRCDRALSGKA